MTRRARSGRVLRGVRIVLGVVVAATLLDVAPTTARAQEAAPVELAGFQGSAAASGLHALYNAGDLLPIPPPVDLGAPDALATIASGPSTFARASVLDPGDLLASPDALLALASGSPTGIPPYPFRVSASSGVGAPIAESNPAPGLAARAEVGDGTSQAQASMPALDAPAIATAGTMSALATTETDGTSVTVHAVSEITDLDVLGVIRIDSIVTDLAATSSGGDAELSGGTRIVGATVLGQAVTIDADGVHSAPGTPPFLGGVLSSLIGSIDDVLQRVGISITLAAPVELEGGGEGQLASAGLRISLELSQRTLPALMQLLDLLPPLESPVPGLPSIDDVLALARGRHLVAIEVGRGVVSLLARPAAAFEPTAPTTPSTSGGAVLPSTTPTFSLPPAAPSSPSAPELPDSPTETASIPAGAGVGSLVLLALLSVPFIGDRISRICAAVLATDPSTTCTWEEP